MANKSKAIIKAIRNKMEIDGVPCSFVSNTVKAAADGRFIGYGAESGTTGSLDPNIARRTEVKRDVKGDIAVDPTFTVARKLIALFFSGSTGSGSGDFTGYTSYALPDDPTADACRFDIRADRVTNRKLYEDVWLNTLKISGQGAQACRFDLSILGADEAADTGDPIEDAAAGSILNGSMCSLKIGSDVYFPSQWEIELSHALSDDEKSFAMGSLIRTHVSAGERIVKVTATFDYNSDYVTALWDALNDGSTAALTWICANGGDGVGLYIPGVEATGELPDQGNDGDIEGPITFLGNKETGVGLVTGYTKAA